MATPTTDPFASSAAAYPTGGAAGAPPVGSGGVMSLPPEFQDPSVLPHDSLQGNAIACVVVTWLIGALFVAARFYTKLMINRSKLGWSEWTILLACFFSLATSVCILMQIRFGDGAHIYDIPPDQLNITGAQEAQWISIVFYALSLGLTKVSILLLYVNIFYHSWVRPSSYVVFAILILSHIWAFYVIFTACIPIEAFWDRTVAGQCQPQTYFLANQYLAIATDVILFFLPIPVLWNLRVKWKQKALLFFLFALGFFVVILSILRIAYITPILANAGVDFTYNGTPVIYWTVVETNTAVVVACAITLKPFIARFLPRLMTESDGTTGNTYGKSGTGAAGGMFTFGGGMRRKGSERTGNNHIRVDSSFTAEYDGKFGDDELGFARPSTARSGGRRAESPILNMASETTLRKAYMG